MTTSRSSKSCTSRARAPENYRVLSRFGITAALCLATFVFSFRLLSFSDAKWAIIAITLPVIAVVAPPTKTTLRPFWPLLLLVIYALFLHDLLWPQGNAIEVYRWAIGLGVLVLFAASANRHLYASHSANLLESIAIVLAILAWLQFFEWINPVLPPVPDYGQPLYGVFGNQNLNAALIATGFGVSLTRAFDPTAQRRVHALVTFFLVSGLLVLGSRSASLAAVAAGICVLLNARRQGFIGVMRLPYGKTAVALTALCAALFVSPLASEWARTLSPSDIGSSTRTWIWDAVVPLLREHWFLGIGPGSFAYLSPLAMGEAAWTGNHAPTTLNEVQTFHTHSEPMQIVLELGVVALFPIGYFFLRGYSRATPANRAALIALITYSLFNPVLNSPIHLLFGLLLLTTRPIPDDAPISIAPVSRIIAAGEAILLALLVLSAIVMPSYRLASARDAYDRSGSTHATIAAYARATDSIWSYPDAWIELAIVAGEHEEWDSVMAALQTVSDKVDTGEYYYLIGDAFEAAGDTEPATEAFREALIRWPGDPITWSRYLYLLPPQRRENVLTDAARFLTPEEYVWLQAVTPTSVPEAEVD
jgi:O-antigen ligase